MRTRPATTPPSSTAAPGRSACLEAGYAGFSWPKEYGGRGATLVEQALFGEEMAHAKAPQPANVLGMVMGGPGGHRARRRHPEGALAAPDPLRRRDLVPGLLRARVRVGPRVAEDARREVERRVGRDRAEGLDHLRPQGQVVHARGADRPGRAQAPGPHLLHHGHGAGGRAGAPAPPDHRRGGVQRALHRGGAHPRRERRRRRGQRLDGRDHHADARARRPRRRRRPPACGSRSGSSPSWPASAA